MREVLFTNTTGVVINVVHLCNCYCVPLKDCHPSSLYTMVKFSLSESKVWKG